MSETSFFLMVPSNSRKLGIIVENIDDGDSTVHNIGKNPVKLKVEITPGHKIFIEGAKSEDPEDEEQPQQNPRDDKEEETSYFIKVPGDAKAMGMLLECYEDSNMIGNASTRAIQVVLEITPEHCIKIGGDKLVDRQELEELGRDLHDEEEKEQDPEELSKAPYGPEVDSAVVFAYDYQYWYAEDSEQPPAPEAQKGPIGPPPGAQPIKLNYGSDSDGDDDEYRDDDDDDDGDPRPTKFLTIDGESIPQNTLWDLYDVASEAPKDQCPFPLLREDNWKGTPESWTQGGKSFVRTDGIPRDQERQALYKTLDLEGLAQHIWKCSFGELETAYHSMMRFDPAKSSQGLKDMVVDNIFSLSRPDSFARQLFHFTEENENVRLQQTVTKDRLMCLLTNEDPEQQQKWREDVALLACAAWMWTPEPEEVLKFARSLRLQVMSWWDWLRMDLAYGSCFQEDRGMELYQDERLVALWKKANKPLIDYLDEQCEKWDDLLHAVYEFCVRMLSGEGGEEEGRLAGSTANGFWRYDAPHFFWDLYGTLTKNGTDRAELRKLVDEGPGSDRWEKVNERVDEMTKHKMQKAMMECWKDFGEIKGFY
ncbi:hypothetical protein MKZ38_004762 [Zalerion maritima]|uniref:Uncharacterized protein n=1 Tax=Zalerion maritima TaxID=339359 RepID=A0AAD5RX94_9PEZI|nr:hypothetical protein MKZ38_004762 [Zalerion maritima]